MKTYMAKGETLDRKWYVVDATEWCSAVLLLR